uniref:Acyl-CoA-binding domain-containing protein 5 n=1 Tax=Strigamia maritima TaxID=126957 RepID=T1JHX8_STRMM
MVEIVETMSYTENIEKFMDVLGPFYEFLDMDTKQLTNGDGILHNGSGDAQLLEKGNIIRKSKEILSEKYTSDSDSENDEYADPIEVQIDDIKILKKIVIDHNDNDSGFADQVEFSRLHNLQNGNGHQLNGITSRDWPSYNRCDDPPVGTTVKGLVARGGGDEDGAAGSGGPIGQRRGNQSVDNRRQSGYRELLNQPNLGLLDRQVTSTSVGGNGRGGPGSSEPLPDNISEQIAVALLRLQRDMDSVLARLNVLETVALAQHNTVQERFGTHLTIRHDIPESNSKRWWPFKDMPCRSFLFFLTWPVIVHVIIKILANRRARRHNC